MVSLSSTLLSPVRRAVGRRHPAPASIPLPAGSIGGLGFGGGMPCDPVPVFHSNTITAELPWRAAGGKVHPMAVPVTSAPNPTDALAWSDGWGVMETPLPDPADIPDYPLPIFDQVVRESGWHPSEWSWPELAPPEPWPTSAAGPQPAQAVAEPLAVPAPAPRPSWSEAPTQLLPALVSTRNIPVVLQWPLIPARGFSSD
jgi:hypothetical protein